MLKLINMTKGNSCIRVFADVKQIENCKKLIKEINPLINSIVQVTNLAGNEVRFKILYLLFKQDKLCVCDLSDVLEMNVAAISQHLRKLKDGGVLENQKIGQTVFYSISASSLPILLPLFDKVKTFDKIKTK